MHGDSCELERSRTTLAARLHDLEVRNALRVAHGRGRLESDELAQCLEQLKDDLEASRLAQIGCKRLVSGDDRQLALAKAAGLEPVDTKKRSKD